MDTTSCDHPTTRTVPTQPGSRHYARLECAKCGGFLRFLPNPANVERRKQNVAKAAWLSKLSELESWEREFTGNILKFSGSISPKHQNELEEIYARHYNKNLTKKERGDLGNANTKENAAGRCAA